MLARLRIGPKLLLAPAAVVLLLVFSSCASYLLMLSQHRAFEQIVHQRAARIRDSGALLAEARQAHANVYQLLTWRGASFSDARVDGLARALRQHHASLARRFASIGQGGAGDRSGRRLLRLGQGAFLNYLHDVGDVLELAQQDHSMSASAMSKAERSFDVVERHLASLAVHEQALSERAQRDARADFDAAVVLMPFVVGLSVALTAAITLAVRAALLRELDAIGAAASGLRTGDLRVPRRSYGRDEIAETSRALDASIRSLNRTLRALAVDGGTRDPADDQRLARRGEDERRRVLDAAASSVMLQRQAHRLAAAVALLKLDEPAPPALRLAGGLGQPPDKQTPDEQTPADSHARGRLHLAAQAAEG